MLNQLPVVPPLYLPVPSPECLGNAVQGDLPIVYASAFFPSLGRCFSQGADSAFDSPLLHDSPPRILFSGVYLTPAFPFPALPFHPARSSSFPRCSPLRYVRALPRRSSGFLFQSPPVHNSVIGVHCALFPRFFALFFSVELTACLFRGFHETGSPFL